MAHGIEETDSLLLYKEKAWHGLGTIVEERHTATEGLLKVGLDWNVIQKPCLVQAMDGTIQEVPKHQWNIREDTGKILGLVGPNFVNVQNRELAAFTDGLVENGDKIVLESAGSLRGGERVWFLARGESFSIRRDEITEYLCVTNGFDGFTVLQAIPTSIRAVCANTLNMVLQVGGKGTCQKCSKTKRAIFKVKHTGSIMNHLEQAKAVLGLYREASEHTREIIQHLDKKNFDTELAQKFFFKQYTKDVELVPANPETRGESNAVERARVAWAHLEQRLDAERDLTGGTSMWSLLQAYTGWYQNDKVVSAKDPLLLLERTQESKLFGSGSQSALDAMTLALSI